MRIVCLGSVAQDTIDAANRRYALTSSTSQKMLDFYNAEGGNTPIKRSTPLVAKDEPGFFEKAWGIFEKLGTIATPAPTVIHTVKPAGPPIAAIAGVGIVALILLKAVK
jgi:hypothetical protein